MKLYRPVGLQELEKILNFGSEKFPDRQVWQPILYIVENYGYAEQISATWNLRDENSGFSGYIKEFTISDDYMKNYEIKQVGDRTHLEYWIPAKDMRKFNSSLTSKIKITNAFYGKKYKGLSFDGTVLEDKKPDKQISELTSLMENSYEKFEKTIGKYKIQIIPNLIYWMKMFSDLADPDKEEKTKIIYEIEKILSETYEDYNDIIIDMKSWENNIQDK